MAVRAFVRFTALLLSLLFVVGPSTFAAVVDSFCDTASAEVATDSPDESPSEESPSDTGAELESSETVDDDVCDVVAALHTPQMGSLGWPSHDEGFVPDRDLKPADKVA